MILDVIFLAALASIAAGLGLRILDLFEPEDGPDRLALGLPLGLGALALGALGLGEAGLLTPVGVTALCLIAAAWGGPRLARLKVEPRPSNLTIWDAMLAFVLIATFVSALAPVTDGDALCYHLQVPKVFLAQGSVGFEPDLHETVYPLATEMLYAVALAVRGPVACRLVQWLLGVTFALNVAALARPILGDKARWAATAALLAPAVSNGMAAPLNDVALAAFGNAALVAWMHWRDRKSAAAAALAGVLAGLAIGVKYPALVLVGLIAAAMAAESLRETRGNRARMIAHAIIWGFVVVAVGGAWYLRAYLATGNPVFPYFRHVFGGAGLDEVLDPTTRPMQPTLWNLLTALGPMTLDPARFDSVSHQFGPLFLLALPALFLGRTPRRVWLIAAMGYAFLTICLTQRQSMRFVLIAVGPMAVAAAWVAAGLSERRTTPARIVSVALVLVLAFEAAIGGARTRHALPVVLGRETRESYLARREPTYRVGRWIDLNLPSDARIVGQEHRGYYLPRPYSMELAHRRRTGLASRGESAETIIDSLRNDGFTHVLLCPPDPEDAVEFDPTLTRALAPWLAARRPLYRETIRDPDGVVRLYSIYALDAAPAAVAVRR